MYTREQLEYRFNPPSDIDPDLLPRLTSDQLDTLEAIQAAGKEHGEQGLYPDQNFGADADWVNGIGELISRLEAELGIDDGSVFELYSEAHSESFADGTINPKVREALRCEGTASDRIFDFQFGAYGNTKVSVHAASVEKALELAADWLAEHAPGHLILADEQKEMWDNAARDLGYDTIPQSEWTDEMTIQVDEEATVDLTYTEAGYLRSWEWYVNERK